jgi:hypothetical protein
MAMIYFWDVPAKVVFGRMYFNYWVAESYIKMSAYEDIYLAVLNKLFPGYGELPDSISQQYSR